MVTYFTSVFAAKNFAMNKAFTSLNTKCGYYVLAVNLSLKTPQHPAKMNKLARMCIPSAYISTFFEIQTGAVLC